MLPHTHLLSGIVMGLVGYKAGILDNGFEVAVVAILTIAFDIDHLIVYFVRHRKLDVLDCWNTSVNRDENQRTFMHKSPGFFIILGISLVLLFFSQKLFYILASAYFTHILLDKINMKRKYMIEFSHFFKKHLFFVPLNYLEELAVVFFIVVIFVLLA